MIVGWLLISSFIVHMEDVSLLSLKMLRCWIFYKLFIHIWGFLFLQKQGNRLWKQQRDWVASTAQICILSVLIWWFRYPLISHAFFYLPSLDMFIGFFPFLSRTRNSLVFWFSSQANISCSKCSLGYFSFIVLKDQAYIHLISIIIFWSWSSIYLNTFYSFGGRKFEHALKHGSRNGLYIVTLGWFVDSVRRNGKIQRVILSCRLQDLIWAQVFRR